MAGRAGKTKDEAAPMDTAPADTSEPERSLWDDETLASRVAEVVYATVAEALAAAKPGAPQASAVTAERVVELERQLAEAGQTVAAYSDQIRELERQLAKAESHGLGMSYEHGRAEDEAAGLRDLLAAAYVTREVPWSDVAAGMMTIARDGTPWMVAVVLEDGRVELHNAAKTFLKVCGPNETVRVLVPYVTPEQAEELVRTELGGTEVKA